MRPVRWRCGGFTLFEVLIAVSIFAVIGVIAMTNLIQVGRSGERIEQSDRQLSALQFTLARIGKDLLQLVPRPVRDQYGDQRPMLELREQRLAFTRGGWSNLLQQPRSNLQRVEYRVDEESLVRRFWPLLDQGFEDRPIDQTLLQGVDDLQWRLLTRGNKEHDRWPLDEALPDEQMPVAVALSFDLAGFGRVERVYELPQGPFDLTRGEQDDGR
jgi:general secretion pathway protein J